MAPRDVHNAAVRFVDGLAARLPNSSFIGFPRYGFDGANARMAVYCPNSVAFEDVPVYSARQYDADGFLVPSGGVVHRHPMFIAVDLAAGLVQFQIRDAADDHWFLGMSALVPQGVVEWARILSTPETRVQELE